MKSSSRWIIIVLLLIAAGAGWWWFSRLNPVVVPQAAAPGETAPAASVAPPPPPPVEAAASAIEHPVEAINAASAPETGSLPALDESDGVFKQALDGLLGRETVLKMLNVDGFAQRFVATVDNLARNRVSTRVWALQPPPGKFETTEGANGPVLAEANAGRYTAAVNLVTSIDSARAAAVYVRLYPLFQKAYENLGYPNKYFNDRLVAVIDLLLQTPEPTGPLALVLPEIQGPYPSTRPWVRYQFADPSLEALSAGQKLLLRMGPANEAKVKAKLREVRARITGKGAPR